MDSSLRSEIISRPDELARIAPAWRRLAEVAGNVEVSPEWFDAWRIQQGPAEDAVVVTVFAGEELVALLPVERTRVHGLARLRFPGAHIGDLFEPLLGPRAADRSLRLLLRCLSREVGWGSLVLHHVERDAFWWKHPGSPFSSTEIGSDVSPYVELRGKTWESYLADMSRRFRARLKMNSLRARHEVRIRQTAELGELRGDLATVNRLHAHRYPGSQLLEPGVRRFHEAFADSALRRGWLRLTICEADGEDIAGFYGWRIGDRFCFYQLGFDPRFDRHSLGLGIIGAALQTAFNEGAGTFELLRGGEDYKQRLASHTRQLVSLVMTRRASPSRLLVALAARRLRAGGSAGANEAPSPRSGG